MNLLRIVRGLVFAGWVIWLLVYWKGGRDVMRALKAPRTRLDAGLLISITGDALVVLVTGLLVQVGKIAINPALDALSLVGAALATGGMWGTFAVRQHLGRAWTAQTTVEAGQALVEQGPYGMVRHPIYSAAIVMYIGLGLLIPLWWVGLVVLSIVLGYVLKTYDEDRYLLKNLPGYRDYAGRVRCRLIPSIW